MDFDDPESFDEEGDEDAEEGAAEEPAEERYFIDADWHEQQGLSFSDVVRERMCIQCQRRIGEDIEERYPVVDRKTRKVTYELRRVQYGARPVAVIRDCCAHKQQFVVPDMPVLEAIFRILLANGNQPMPLEHIRDQLREWCPTGRCQWLLLPPETIRRIVENDQFYGLRRHEVVEAA
ncbi:MAG: hypothetical protein A3F84_01635 [Candidatus Handelsmanbacteria bacterium RIFCSPLOWO2_12_FULL_64_10]|uniref:Uncharacterized protein n=1 Tax=Handelsmanbacteria sp. (strain RIFCSPLOWO2_12_FULL_64_10) TaxID=1817868 RepID=A0A1F6D4G0_HANXR|nr:MAG: hypothetical protein A3F84_01635 [Candidatus Handelsmanbacteria bacterium RIFCSPLOWO2_12_FULL_64_10]